MNSYSEASREDAIQEIKREAKLEDEGVGIESKPNNDLQKKLGKP